LPAQIDLPDVNVWLAFTLPDHVHHARATAYWQHASAEKVALCRITALAYVRLSTNASVMAGQPLTVSDAWSAYSALRRLPEVTFALEPAGCEGAIEHIVLQEELPPRLWTDAYLAAFAISGTMRFVTFDTDFERFEELDLLLL
jgi:hypothetical protein